MLGYDKEGKEMDYAGRVIEQAQEYVRGLLKDDYTGHDFYHSLRVFHMAKLIAEKEKCDVLTVQIAALLHDVDDEKLFGKQHEVLPNAVHFMRSNHMEEEFIKHVCQCIKEVSFRGTDSVKPHSIEGMIVQDADRIDAIGAIGIARTFAYGGNRNHAIYDPDEIPCLSMDNLEYRNHKCCSINHFYEKLLKLKDLMNTETAKQIAEHRHKYMEAFLQEFFFEWEGKR